MGKVIVVVSGKGGTGKTTTVGALSSCLAALGHRTLCIDCDAGLRNLDIVLGMSEYAVTDFTDVLEGLVGLEEACFEHPRIKGLFFLPAPAFQGPEEVDNEAMSALIGRARENFEYCLVDSPAGIGPGFRLAARGADMALIVALCDLSSVRDAQRVAAQLRELGVTEARLVVNRVSRRNFKRLGMTVDDIIDTVGAQLIGLVDEDESVFLAANAEVPLVLYSGRGAAVEFLQIARRLAGERVPLSRRFTR